LLKKAGEKSPVFIVYKKTENLIKQTTYKDANKKRQVINTCL